MTQVHTLEPTPLLRPAWQQATPPDRDAHAAMQQLETFLRSEQARRQLFGEAGQITRVREADGGDFQYAYDANGDLLTLTEANGRSTQYQYDAQRRLCSVAQSTGQRTTYSYNAQDRLATMDADGLLTRYDYDRQGRVAAIQHGQGEVSIYRYDDAGRVTLARTSQVTTRWRYDHAGRTTQIEQSIHGVPLVVKLAYAPTGCLSELTLPGSEEAIQYRWDGQGRPQTVCFRQRVVAHFAYEDRTKTTVTTFGNGIMTHAVANPTDARPVQQTVQRGEQVLWRRALHYGELGEVRSDGERAYRYDHLGRLIGTTALDNAQETTFAYDAVDNLTRRAKGDQAVVNSFSATNQFLSATNAQGEQTHFVYDRWGRLTERRTATTAWGYRYDDAGHLREIQRNHELVARFLYDHKGRLVWAESAGQVERYLYGDADELLAVTDAQGRPLQIYLRTIFGVLAEVQDPAGAGAIFYHHADERGTLRLLTDATGEVVARFAYDPFGQPAAAGQESTWRPLFMGRRWFAACGLYYFGARWYDPTLARFLTPDSYTGAPDDARLLNPLQAASQQAARRSQILHDWLKQPRVRNRYAFCNNDPINRVDPNGHWSFGGVLLMLLGAIWTLPNTLFGILVEITCLVGEVIRWLVWLCSGGNVSWATPGFDAAASGNLNAFALVFRGGWLGSFSNLLGITFGNVFFVYDEWEKSPYLNSLPDPIYPPAYNGTVSIPRSRMLYEHELRHTNQYGWIGPFYHLGLPLFGYYEWALIFSGYQNMWAERDARAHAEP